MDNFSIRKDDFSLQVTSPASRKLFVRLVEPHAIRDRATFSDVLFEDEEANLASRAIVACYREVASLRNALRLEFLDIMPNSMIGKSQDVSEADAEIERLKGVLETALEEVGVASSEYETEVRNGKKSVIFHVSETKRSTGNGLLSRIVRGTKLPYL